MLSHNYIKIGICKILWEITDAYMGKNSNYIVKLGCYMLTVFWHKFQLSSEYKSNQMVHASKPQNHSD